MTPFLESQKIKLDNEKVTIRFMDESIKPQTVEECVTIAFSMKPTIKEGLNERGKKRRFTKQSLGSTRSIQDLYLIAKHYVPESSMEDVLTTLKELKSKKHLHSHWCRTFKRMMFRKEYSPYSWQNGTLINYGI